MGNDLCYGERDAVDGDRALVGEVWCRGDRVSESDPDVAGAIGGSGGGQDGAHAVDMARDKMPPQLLSCTQSTLKIDHSWSSHSPVARRGGKRRDPAKGGEIPGFFHDKERDERRASDVIMGGRVMGEEV